MGWFRTRFKCFCRPRAFRRPWRRKPRLLIAGATGALGNEVLRRLAGSAAFASPACWRASRSRDGLRGVETRVAPSRRSRNGRSRGRHRGRRCSIRRGCTTTASARCGRRLRRSCPRWRAGCAPAACARWPSCCRTRQGRLPEALKRGLASLDEQAVVANGFERVILVRSAQQAAECEVRNPGRAAGAWMLSILRSWCPAASSRCARPRWPNWSTSRCASRRRACTWPRRSWCGRPAQGTADAPGGAALAGPAGLTFLVQPRHWRSSSADSTTSPRCSDTIARPPTPDADRCRAPGRAARSRGSCGCWRRRRCSARSNR
jgi:hypothetical protein